MRLCFESKEIDEERTIDEGGSTQISQKNHRELLLTVSSFVRYILRTNANAKDDDADDAAATVFEGFSCEILFSSGAQPE